MWDKLFIGFFSIQAKISKNLKQPIGSPAMTTNPFNNTIF